MFTVFQGMLHSCGVSQETPPHCWLLSDASQHRHRKECTSKKHSPTQKRAGQDQRRHLVLAVPSALQLAAGNPHDCQGWSCWWRPALELTADLSSKLVHPETLISIFPCNFRTLGLKRWGSFFPCLSGGGPKDVKPTDISFHWSTQEFWSFTLQNLHFVPLRIFVILLLFYHLSSSSALWCQPTWYFGCPFTTTALLAVPLWHCCAWTCTWSLPSAPALCLPAHVPWLSWPSQWMPSSLPSCC